MLAEIVGSFVETLLEEALWKAAELAKRVPARRLSRALARLAFRRTSVAG